MTSLTEGLNTHGVSMAKAKEDRAGGKYLDTLFADERKRYIEKTVDIGGVDPYEIPKELWSRDPEGLPDVCYMDSRKLDSRCRSTVSASTHVCEEFKAFKV